jgi:hypothetical protein
VKNKGFALSVLAILVLLGIIFLNNRPAPKPSAISPCEAIKTIQPRLDPRDRNSIKKNFIDRYSIEILTAVYIAKPNDLQSGTIGYCTMDDKGVTVLTIVNTPSMIVLQRKYATIDDLNYPNITGPVWQVIESIDIDSHPMLYRSIKKSFANQKAR